MLLRDTKELMNNLFDKITRVFESQRFTTDGLCHSGPILVPDGQTAEPISPVLAQKVQYLLIPPGNWLALQSLELHPPSLKAREPLWPNIMNLRRFPASQ